MSVLEGSRLTDHDFKNMDEQTKLTTSKKKVITKNFSYVTLSTLHMSQQNKILGNYILGRLRTLYDLDKELYRV